MCFSENPCRTAYFASSYVADFLQISSTTINTRGNVDIAE
jgi:hypothetical protein